MADNQQPPDPAGGDPAKQSDLARFFTITQRALGPLAVVISALSALSGFLQADARNRTETLYYALAAVGGVLLVIAIVVFARKLRTVRIGMLSAMLVLVMVASAVAGYLSGHLVRTGYLATGHLGGPGHGPSVTTPPPTAGQTPVGTFSRPFPHEDDIQHCSILNAAGTAGGIAQGHTLRLVLYVASVGKYYLSDPGVPVLSGTRWAGTIFVGGSCQPDETFTLWLVDFGPESLQAVNASPQEQAGGFSTLKLAPDTTALASVNFTVV